MRMPRSLGVVFTACLALGLGVGVGGAAVSQHFTASHHEAANEYGTSQWDDSSAKTAQANVGGAFSEHGKESGKDRSKNTSKDHGAGDDTSQSNDARTSSDSSNHNGTKQLLTQAQFRKILGFIQKHWDGGWECGCNWIDQDGGWKDHDVVPLHFSGPATNVAQHGSNDNWTDQSSKPEAEAHQANTSAPVGSDGTGSVDQSNHAQTKAHASKNGTDQSPKQKQSVSDDKAHKDGSDGGHVSPKGSDDTGTPRGSWSRAIRKRLDIHAPIAQWVKHVRHERFTRHVDVTRSNDARTESPSSNSNRTDQDLKKGQLVRGPGRSDASQDGSNSNRTEQSFVGGDGDGGGRVHQDNSGGPHSSSENGNGSGQHARHCHASSSGHEHA
jgi:hypothetical protein